MTKKTRTAGSSGTSARRRELLPTSLEGVGRRCSWLLTSSTKISASRWANSSSSGACFPPNPIRVRRCSLRSLSGPSRLSLGVFLRILRRRVPVMPKRSNVFLISCSDSPWRGLGCLSQLFQADLWTGLWGGPFPSESIWAIESWGDATISFIDRINAFLTLGTQCL